MDVHVDPGWIHLEKDKGQWVTALGDQRVIALGQGKGHRATIDWSAIDDRHEILAGTAADAGLTQETTEAHTWAREGRHDRDLPGHLTAPNLADTVQ